MIVRKTATNNWRCHCCIVGVVGGAIVGHAIIDRHHHWQCHSKRCHHKRCWLHHHWSHFCEWRMVSKACSASWKTWRTLSTKTRQWSQISFQHQLAQLLGKMQLCVLLWALKYGRKQIIITLALCPWNLFGRFWCNFPPNKNWVDVLLHLENLPCHRHDKMGVIPGYDFKTVVYPMISLIWWWMA